MAKNSANSNKRSSSTEMDSLSHGDHRSAEGFRDEETIFHPLILDLDLLTFVAQSVTCPGMRPFKRLDKKADLFV